MDGRRVSGVVGLLLAVGVLAGCSSGRESGTGGFATSGGGSGNADAARPAAPREAPAADQQKQPANGDQAGSNAPDRQVNQPGLDRKLVRTASLELAAEDVVDVANRARNVAVKLDGYAGQEEVKNDSATITLHIPSNMFDNALDELSGLVGKDQIRSRNVTAEDVTEQLVDVESRIATQRASVDRVRALLARATTVNEIVQIESEVTRREADLESLEKRRETLTGRVALSRVTVRVVKDGTPQVQEERAGGILGALRDGWDAFLGAGGAVLRVLATMLPFLIMFGIPGVWLWRARLRRRSNPRPAVQQEAPA